MNLLKIGDISKTCDISIKTLRFYEEIGLITPAKVDIYTGYRYFDGQNVELIYKIKFLKDLGFTLEEIKNFDESQIDKKLIEVKGQISKLTKNLKTLSSLKQKKENITMKPFINDEQAIGKWEYVANAESKEEYNKGEYFVDKNILLQNLYFLPKGEGFYIFEGWTKGQLNRSNGVTYTYEIVDNIMFLTTFNLESEKENVIVYKKVSNKVYTIDEIRIKDDLTNLKFEKDEDVVGFYKHVGYLDYENRQDLSKLKKTTPFINTISFSPDGYCTIQSTQGIFKQPYTKGKLIHLGDSLISNYSLKRHQNKTYLIIDIKSGDYIFAGKILMCNVFEKI